MSVERKVIESILLLADEPVPASLMGEVLERPRTEVEGSSADPGRVVRGRGPGLRRCERWPAGGASTPTRTPPPGWSAS